MCEQNSVKTSNAISNKQYLTHGFVSCNTAKCLFLAAKQQRNELLLIVAQKFLKP
jgi:hypothetical protein